MHLYYIQKSSVISTTMESKTISAPAGPDRHKSDGGKVAQIIPKTTKSGPKSIPFREDYCFVCKHPFLCTFLRYLFSAWQQIDSFLGFKYNKTAHLIFYIYKNIQLLFK